MILFGCIYQKDSGDSSWENCDLHYNFYACGGNPTYEAPFDFKVVSTSGEVIYAYDLIGNLNAGTCGTMSDTFGSSSSSVEITITNKDWIPSFIATHT